MSTWNAATQAAQSALSTVTTTAVTVNRVITTLDNYVSVAEAHSHNLKQSYIEEAADLSLIHSARRRAAIMQELDNNPAMKAIYLELKASRTPTPAA